jgi:hypothetical protein
LCAAWDPWIRSPAAASSDDLECARCDELDGGVSGDAAAARTPVRPITGVDGLHFLVGDVKGCLPKLLERYPPSEIAVVACHACSHLTDSIIDMCILRGVDFAVMPCCHRDLKTQGQMALVAKSLGIKEHETIDVARMGSILARGYDCRWRTIDKRTTPENRLLVGLARLKPGVVQQRKKIEDNQEAKLVQIYSRIHASTYQPSPTAVGEPDARPDVAAS